MSSNLTASATTLCIAPFFPIPLQQCLADECFTAIRPLALVNRILTILFAALVAACAGTTGLERGQAMDSLASALSWQKIRLDSGDFVLSAYVPENPAQGAVLTVYIEGDGFAWVSGVRPSTDPTPRKPTGLELALQHPAGLVAYLGRPCQNIQQSDWRSCRTTYWTDRRFSPEVIDATDSAITALKARFHAERIALVGFSGGGAVAALVAARREDVAKRVTVAGNLDHQAWTTHHRVDPLTGSLNPADAWERLQHIPQVHWIGANDRVVGVETVGAYAKRFPVARRPVIKVQRDFDHSCCWARDWATLVRESL